MKKTILLLLCCTLLFSATAFVASAEDNYGIAVCNNNVMITDSNFAISNSGYTEILASYYGYPGITTGGVVTTKLQKKNGDTWTDVDEWVEEVTGDTFYQVYTLQLSTRGNYKVTIEYRVSGIGGPDDIIEEELLRTY